MSDQRLLITGGAGCLGSNIIADLGPHGPEILVIDNFSTGFAQSLPKFSNVRLVEGSVADADLMAKTFAGFSPTHVIHAAAAYKDPANWQEDIDTNVTGTANVIRLSDEYRVKRLIYFQTALCYGRPQQIPIPVSAPLSPITSYGITKTAGERLLQLSQTPWVSFRLANVVAPGLAIGPIPTFYKRLKENKPCFCSDTVRDFLDIDDFLAIFRLALEPDAPCGIFNVSTGQGHSMRQVYDIIAGYLKIHAQEPPTVPCAADDIPAVVLDGSLAEKSFAWKPETGFNEMLAKILHWYDQNGVTAIFSHLTAPEQH